MTCSPIARLLGQSKQWVENRGALLIVFLAF